MYSFAVVSAVACRRCAWMSFTDPMLLRLGRHRAAQDLEVQLGIPKRVRQGFQNPVPVVGGVQEASVAFGKMNASGELWVV